MPSPVQKWFLTCSVRSDNMPTLLSLVAPKIIKTTVTYADNAGIISFRYYLNQWWHSLLTHMRHVILEIWGCILFEYGCLARFTLVAKWGGCRKWCTRCCYCSHGNPYESSNEALPLQWLRLLREFCDRVFITRVICIKSQQCKTYYLWAKTLLEQCHIINGISNVYLILNKDFVSIPRKTFYCKREPLPNLTTHKIHYAIWRSTSNFPYIYIYIYTYIYIYMHITFVKKHVRQWE